MQKQQELIEYNKALQEYRNAVCEFNDGDGKTKRKKFDLEELNLSEEEKKLFYFVEIKEWDDIYIIIENSDAFPNQVVFDQMNGSPFNHNTTRIAESELLDKKYIVKYIKETLAYYENMLNYKNDSKYDYFSSILFFKEQPWFNKNLFDENWKIYSMEYPQFWDIDAQKIYTDRNIYLNFKEIVKLYVMHEFTHNIDSQLNDILPDSLHHEIEIWEAQNDSKSFYFSESDIFGNDLDTYLDENNFFTKFIKDDNFLSKELFEEGKKTIPSIAWHPYSNNHEFFTSFMIWIYTLYDDWWLSLQERWELFLNNNNLKEGNNCPFYNDIIKQYKNIIAIFIEKLTALYEYQPSPKQYQLLKSLIHILVSVDANMSINQ